MGQLSDITISTTVVEYRGQDITVRGISVTDLMHVANEFGPELAKIFARVTAGDIKGDLKTQIAQIAKELPELTAAVIAAACDDYTKVGMTNAGKLPFGTQVELIEAVFSETFHSEADVKKLIASLTNMIAATSGALKEVAPELSMSGIGGLGDNARLS